VEEINGSIVRRMIGYELYEDENAWHALAKLYSALSLYINYFQPSLKLLSKKRDGSKRIGELLKGFNSPEEILGQSSRFKQLTKAILERALEGELTTHLGYDKPDVAGNNSGHSRNGHTNKTQKSEHGELPLNVPRDRNSTFSPEITPKNQT
jgi:hypothetical protein